MKSATVADLRNKFAVISRWIYEGESVSIQKRGKLFAILSPAGKEKKVAVQLPDFQARLDRIFPNGPTKGSAKEVVDYMRGDY